jgi:hypothetical protein
MSGKGEDRMFSSLSIAIGEAVCSIVKDTIATVHYVVRAVLLKRRYGRYPPQCRSGENGKEPLFLGSHTGSVAMLVEAFNDEQGQVAHAKGEAARALFAHARELFVTIPQFQTVDILAEKHSFVHASTLLIERSCSNAWIIQFERMGCDSAAANRWIWLYGTWVRQIHKGSRMVCHDSSSTTRTSSTSDGMADHSG